MALVGQEREAPLVNGMTMLSLIAWTVALLGFSLINRHSPTFHPLTRFRIVIAVKNLHLSRLNHIHVTSGSPFSKAPDRAAE